MGESKMSYKSHRIYGRIKDLDLQGFQFNYPIEGAVFDITRQAFVMMTKGLSDESLMQEFIAQMQYGHRYLEDKWKSIREITL